MASAPELVATAAEALGENPKTVSIIMRRLREAGLVEVRGRGPYALKMTMRDAARLLIAICASVPLEPYAASDAVIKFEPLEFIRARTVGDTAALENQPFNSLADSGSFGATLEALLSLASEGKLFGSFPPQQLTILEIKFFRPYPAATIDFFLGGLVKKTLSFGVDLGEGEVRYRSTLRLNGFGDRFSMSSIGDATLTTVGSLILTG